MGLGLGGGAPYRKPWLCGSPLLEALFMHSAQAWCVLVGRCLESPKSADFRTLRINQAPSTAFLFVMAAKVVMKRWDSIDWSAEMSAISALSDLETQVATAACKQVEVSRYFMAKEEEGPCTGPAAWLLSARIPFLGS